MPIGNQTRFLILQRDRFTCRYCGRKAPEVVLEVDHIKPQSKGGEDIATNLITACQQCNNGKSAFEIEGLEPPEFIELPDIIEQNKYSHRIRTTEEDHEWLKENYRKYGFNSAAGLLEHIIKQAKSNGTQKLHE